MPRHPNPAAADPMAEVDTQAVADAAQSIAPMADHSRWVDSMLDASEPFSLPQSVERVRAHMGVSAEHYLLAGLELIRIRENVPEGLWIDALEEDLQLNRRTAHRMMSVAMKYQGRLKGLVKTLNPSKLLELTSEEDDELESLLAGGTIAGLELDDIQRMSRADLAHRLRAEREETTGRVEALGKLLEEKNKKLDDLAAKLAQKDRGPRPDYWAKLAEGLATTVTVDAGQALLHLDALAQARDQILTATDDHGRPIPDSALEHLATTYLDLADQVHAAAYGLLTDAEMVFGGHRDAVRSRLNAATLGEQDMDAALRGEFIPADKHAH